MLSPLLFAKMDSAQSIPCKRHGRSLRSFVVALTLMLLSAPGCVMGQGGEMTQMQILMKLYDSTGGPGWTWKTGWGVGDPCGNPKWTGVTKCVGGKVTSLYDYIVHVILLFTYSIQLCVSWWFIVPPLCTPYSQGPYWPQPNRSDPSGAWKPDFIDLPVWCLAGVVCDVLME